MGINLFNLFGCVIIGAIIHSGYGDSYDDEDDDQYDLEELGDEQSATQKDDDNNIYKDMTRTRLGYEKFNFQPQTYRSESPGKHVRSLASRIKAFPSSRSPTRSDGTVPGAHSTITLQTLSCRRIRRIQNLN